MLDSLLLSIVYLSSFKFESLLEFEINIWIRRTIIVIEVLANMYILVKEICFLGAFYFCGAKSLLRFS